MEVDVAVLGSSSLIVPTVCVDVKRHGTERVWNDALLRCPEQVEAEEND